MARLKWENRSRAHKALDRRRVAEIHGARSRSAVAYPLWPKKPAPKTLDEAKARLMASLKAKGKLTASA